MPEKRWQGGPVESSSHLVHFFNADLTEVTELAVPKSVFGNMDSRFVDITSQLNPGSLTFRENGELLYAPYLYEGVLHRYSKKGGKWEGNQFGNPGRNSESYTEFEAGKELKEYPQRTRMIHSSGGPFVGLVLQESLGLFVTKTGHVVHFALIRKDYKLKATVPELHAELYSPEMDLLSDTVLHPFDMDQLMIRENGRPPFEIQWIDENDRVYLLNPYSAQVAVYQLTVSN